MIAALIQARVGSERLPGKVLKEIPKGSGVSMLVRVIRRLKKSEMIDDIIVVTPDMDCVVIAESEGVKYSKLVQGQRDVIAEFYYAAHKFNVDTVVRITADCPCICPEIVDKIIRIHLDENKDLTYNRNDNLCYCAEIDGLDVEVFSFDALYQAYLHAKEPADREHVTKFMYKNLRTNMVECGWHIENAGEIKLSVDTQEDYERICKIYEVLKPNFTVRQLMEYLAKKKQ